MILTVIYRLPSSKKPKIYKQKYNSQWEKHSELKGWITPVRLKRLPYKALCMELTAGLSELRKNPRKSQFQD